MINQPQEYNPLDICPLPLTEISLEPPLPPSKISKADIRSSLPSLTLEGVSATIFYSIVGGVLLNNFLLDLGAGPVEIGMLASIPQVTNLLQPLGAYLADQTISRRWYSLLIFVPSRLIWLMLLPAIWLVDSSQMPAPELVKLTLAILWVVNTLESLGRASFMSWTAALVPERLRGRYFGFRSSAINLVNLIGVPLIAVAISHYPGGRLEAYSIALMFGLCLGVNSLIRQFFITDVNPHQTKQVNQKTEQKSNWELLLEFLNQTNFLKFLIYSGFWSFSVNISAPFFNLYLLDDLAIDVSIVTLYNSLGAGANLLMLMVWGKLADRVGNRPLMITIGILVSLTPLLWLEAGTTPFFLWVWFPLLFILGGGTWAAIDLCSGNLLMSVSPLWHQSIYFAIAAAVPGVTGALGITLGSYLATFSHFGGLPGLFALSAVLRLVALLPLVFVHESRAMSLQKLRVFFRFTLWKKEPT